MNHYLRFAVVIAILVEIYSLLPKKTFVSEKPLRHYVRGIFHVHSTFSDGGGTPEQIAIAARDAGQDFVILTDHNNSEARKAGFERTYDGVDLFVEMEASTPAGHAVSLFTHSSELSGLSDATINHMTWEHYLDPKGEMIVVISHPSNIKNPWTRFDRYPEGLEIINLDSIWQRDVSDSPFSFIGTLLLYPMNNYLSALRYLKVYDKDLTTWDAANLFGPGHFGILAHDTHAKIKITGDMNLHWPSYLSTFRLASNIVFIPGPQPASFQARQKTIYQSIREGKLAFLFQFIHPFDGNDLSVRCQRDKDFFLGDKIKSEFLPCDMTVTLPPDLPYTHTVRVFRNGEPFKELSGTGIREKVSIKEPGTYRAEVWVNPVSFFHILVNDTTPYLFYNPVYVQ